MPRVMRETSEFSVDALARDGDGLAGATSVAGALPGERVEARLEGAHWVADAVLVASPHRAKPFCPEYGRCGGCVAQHMDAPLYGDWKRQRIVDALAKADIGVPVAPLVDAHGAGRRRATFHARFPGEAAPEVGFMRRRSHAIIDIDACPLLCAALGEAPRVAREVARGAAGAGKPLDIQITACLTGLDVDIRGLGPPDEALARGLIRRAESLDLARLSVHGRTLIERRRPVIMIDGVEVTPPAGGFLQATEAGEDAIAALALPALKGAKTIADLFSGCGAFALRLARRHEVFAVDGDAPSIRALAEASARADGRRGLETLTRDLHQRPLRDAELDRFDGVLFDPPRAGAEAQARALAASQVPVVVAVSCDAGTFARDAALLIGGGYRLESVTPIDQFKHSAHVETVGVFGRTISAKRKKGWLS